MRMPQATSSKIPVVSSTANIDELSLSSTIRANETHSAYPATLNAPSRALSKSPASRKPTSYASPKVLVQHGVTLTQLDRDSMNNNGWYTDTIIAYSQAHIAVTIPSFFLAKTVMMRPSEVSLISSVATENIEVLLQVFNDNPVRKEIEGADYVIVPINSPQKGIAAVEAGVHWSILMLDRKSKKALHYDSRFIQGPKPGTKAGLNEQHAIVWLNRFEFVFDALPRNSSEQTARYVLKRRLDTTQDTSGSGCGPVACWITKMLIKDILLDLPAGQRFDFSKVNLSAQSIHTERVRLRLVVDEAIDCWWPSNCNEEMDKAAWQRAKEKSSSLKRVRIEEDGVAASATDKRDESPPKKQKTRSNMHVESGSSKSQLNSDPSTSNSVTNNSNKGKPNSRLTDATKNSIVPVDLAIPNNTTNTEVRLTQKEQPQKGGMKEQRSQGKSNGTAIEISSASEISDEPSSDEAENEHLLGED